MIQLIQLILAILIYSTFTNAAKYQTYPITELDPTNYKTYESGDEVKFECIRRQIDNGEHLFDEQGNIIYAPFAKCLETNAPFQFSYLKDSRFKCTVKFEDELFHLFQLYLHKDAPLTCRFELRPNSGIYLPIDLSFRGNVLESHVDIDPNLNVLMIANDEGEIISGSAFSSSTNTTKVIIGQNVELNFNVRWNKLEKEWINDDNVGVYWILSNNKWIKWIFATAGFVVGIIVTIISSYRRINKKVQLSQLSNKVE